MPVTEPESILVGAAGGAMLPLILREYKDKPAPTARLGPFEVGDLRRPSVFGSIGLGSIATFFGLMGARGKGPLGANEPAAHTAAAFGGASIMGGLGSWMFPPEEVAPEARARGVTLAVGRPAVTLAVPPVVVPEVAVGPEIGRPRPRRAETPSGEALGGF